MTNVIFFFNSFSSSHFHFPSLVPNPPPFPSFLNHHKKNFTNSVNSFDKTLIGGALSGVLSIGLLLHSPSSIALDYSPVQIFSLSADSLPSSSSSESSASCIEDEVREFESSSVTVSTPATNEDIVREAWEIVNDSFLDAGRHRWSPEAWKVWTPLWSDRSHSAGFFFLRLLYARLCYSRVNYCMNMYTPMSIKLPILLYTSVRLLQPSNYSCSSCINTTKNE